METISKILVPLDFSAHSTRALHYAVDLAQHYDGAKLELVHVFDATLYALPDARLLSHEQFEQTFKDLERMLADAKSDAQASGAQAVDTLLLQGKPDEEITRRAREGKFDVIVLGTHGRTGIKHMLIGSVAERIVRSSPCPVFAVKALAATSAPSTTAANVSS